MIEDDDSLTDEHGRFYFECPGMDSQADSNGPPEDDEERRQVRRGEANLISSLCADGQHRPVIDFDVPVRLVPSTTAGHGHLYIDVPMTDEAFLGVLEALHAAGVVQAGYLNGAKMRGQAFVRPPWVKKPERKKPETDPEPVFFGPIQEGPAEPPF